MSQLPGEPSIKSTTINRVSALTLLIPIKQELTAPLVLGPPPRFDTSAAPVRPLDNLRTIVAAIQAYVAEGKDNALNQIATIHYARWVIVNDGQDLLFCANFDSSFDQYLSDFMVIANRHSENDVPWMDLLWGNCVGYPGGEATHFISWARSYQIETTLFFPTISDLTVRDIAWLRKFKHLYDTFDQEVQTDDWPPELKKKYEAFKRDVNAIDVSVVT